LYRINNDKETRALGIEELFNQKNIIAIEWANQARGVLPKDRIEIHFNYCPDKENQRRITVNKL
jgi:tRNA A37 threonylcarbamoyladenosine biosynthesis protein TsaE